MIFGQVLQKENDIIDTASFLFWGDWLLAAAKPGDRYSSTHNWPHAPLAGNIPTLAKHMGQVKHEDGEFSHKGKPLITLDLQRWNMAQGHQV